MIWFQGLGMIFKMYYYRDKKSNICNMHTKIYTLKALRLNHFITGSLGNHENMISFPLMTFCDQQYVEFPKIFNEVCDLNIPLGKDPFSEDYYHSFEKHFGFNDTGYPINIGN